LFDMKNEVHSSCVYLVFQPCIQASLDRTRDGWNHHKIQTERNKTPIAIYELSREAAIARVYLTGDLGDDLNTLVNDPLYSYDGEAPLPPAGEAADDAAGPPAPESAGIQAERDAGNCVNGDNKIAAIKELMPAFDEDDNDQNWGTDMYCRSV
ncbi:hypothetical protein B0H14DRAFT_2296889, partial [Mycena olivaceomarginata]